MSKPRTCIYTAEFNNRVIKAYSTGYVRRYYKPGATAVRNFSYHCYYTGLHFVKKGEPLHAWSMGKVLAKFDTAAEAVAYATSYVAARS